MARQCTGVYNLRYIRMESLGIVEYHENYYNDSNYGLIINVINKVRDKNCQRTTFILLLRVRENTPDVSHSVAVS